MWVWGGNFLYIKEIEEKRNSIRRIFKMIKTEISDITVEYVCPKCKRTLVHFSPYAVPSFGGLLSRLTTDNSRCQCGNKYKVIRVSYKERSVS